MSGTIWRMAKYSCRSLIYFCLFLLATLGRLRDEWIMARILKQYQESPPVADINVVVGEPQPEAHQQTVENAIETAADDSNETSRSHDNKNKDTNKGQGKNNGKQAKASHNIGTKQPRDRKK
ncbi:hypothetical protein CGRA01v4_14070 [Colletotrichum graminicola]|uniref:Uncharacterized protein n=1 Tax=Colletotrichum graminicola (strain M1.001 / M2 / FGSC 10212) TaxID=645133 RepID=E3QUU6_COLGM|nr:uncharacterized protein GLRG_09778 [Colletotrichum graminicola M1.001]EFQ34634.1 hypothetical protein GLRG_09778 [Colletotrichum graminicola M1.001]WDK22780.1 hypothetical protein CGRA01v4_14070 [Colletotrichum graminicola]